MFLSNWLVFKIVLAAVTGLVDYPLAADVLLVYDNANKLYLSGGSLEYVSNVVLYKGETSYEIEGPNFIAGDEQKITASDAASSDQFGYSVVIDGDYAIIGSVNNNTAYIFKRDGSTGVWAEQTKLIPTSDAQNSTSDKFGYSVGISGNYAIVGAPEYNHNQTTNAGAAYIFVKSGTTWTQQEKLIASDLGGYDFFGRSVSISGEYAIIGAPLWDIGSSDTIEGVAYIFKRDGTSWSEQEKLIASDAGANDNFGASVSISGDYAIVGAWPEDEGGSDAGAAYIFKREGTSWSQQYKLIASDSQSNDNFGWSVDIDGDYVIVGARNGDSNVIDSGSAYVFKRDGTTWSQQAKLKASDAAASDKFGWSVSITGDYAIVGAYNNDDNNASSSGSAYIFKRNGTSWSQQQKLLASDPAQDDEFGESVAISEDCVIVGAYRKNSYTGAAYVYPLKEVTNYYITQPGTYRADLQICGIDYKTNTVEVTTLNPGNAVYTNDLTETSEIDHGTSTSTLKACSVSLDGTRIALGADNGRVKLYHRESGTWTLKKEYTKSGSFGTQVCLNDAGTRLFVSDPSDNSNTGKVYVYDYSGSAWGSSETHSWVSPNGSTSDKFGGTAGKGISCNSAGTRLLVVNGYTGSKKGYIFDYTGSSWNTAPTKSWSSGSLWWGSTCALNDTGDRAFIGYQNGVDIFHYDGSNWPTSATKNYTGSDKFGTSLTINGAGTRLLVGSYEYSSSAGQTTLYDYVGSSWNTAATQTISGPYGGNSYYGHGVNMSRDGKRYLVAPHNASTYFSAGGLVDMMEDTSGTGTFSLKQTFEPDAASEYMGSYQFHEGLCLDQKGYTAVILSTGTDVSRIYSSNPIPTLDFDNYNKLSLTNTPTNTSSKLFLGSNVYDIGTLTSDLTIENPGEYTSLTFDTSSNVAYFSNATVGAIASTTASYGKQDQVLTADQDAGYSNGDASQGGYGNSIDMSADGTRMVVGNAHYTDTNGRVWLYHLENGLWVLKQTWDGGTRLGSQVAMNEAGTRAFALYIGGGVKIWDYSSGAWDTSASGTYAIAPGSINGEAPAVDCNKTGDVVIIGAGNSDNTWIYRLSGGSWSSEKNFPRKGSGVSMNGAGTRCFMGDRSSHKVWESNYSSGSWGTETEIIEDTSVSSSYWPLALSTDSAGETLCILNSTSGEGAIYERAGNGSWSASVSGILSKSEVYGPDKAGISYDGTMALFGHHSNSGALSTGGHALLYTKSGSTWSITQTLLNPSSSQHSNDYFGGGIGLAKTAKDRFVIAAIGDDNAGTNYGAIYTYTNAIPDFISFDTYNKLSLSGITNPTSKLHALPTGAESTTTYDIGTATNIYIESEGTYTVEMKGSDAFALDSNTASLTTPSPNSQLYYPLTSQPSANIWSSTTDVSYGSDGVTFNSTSSTFGLEFTVPTSGIFTVSCNFMKTSFTSGVGVIIASSTNQNSPELESNFTATSYAWRSTNTGYVNTTGLTHYTNQWYHMVWVHDKNNGLTAYLDGVEVYSYSGTIGSPQTSFIVGPNYRSGTITNQFGAGAKMSDIRIYDTAISPTEAELIYRADNKYIPKLNFDTYNKLTFTGADTDSTYKLKYESNTYDLGTISNVYIAYPGTYSAEIKGATNFALSSNITGGTITPYKVWKENEDQILYGSDPGAGDHFGHAVAVDGNYAVVGSRYNDTGGTDRGAAFIFHKSGGTWTEQAMVQPSDTANDDWFGRGVAISGDYVIVNAYAKTTNNTGQGAAYIFYRSGTSWTQQAKLNASDGEAGDAYSYSVDIDGDYAIVGSLNEDPGGTSNAGSAYIYVRSGTSWSQQAKIQASDKEANDTFGRGVTISGDYAAVGADNEDTSGSNAGSVYIFKYDATTPPDDLPPVDSVGTGFNYKRYTALDTSTHYVYKMWRNSASDWRTPSPASANTIKVLKTDSTDWSDNDTTDTNPEYVDTTTYSGKVSLGQSAGPTENYRFSVPTFGSWSQQQKIQSDDIQADDYFGGGAGQGVSLSGDTLAVGARKEDTGGSEAGSVYIFKKASGSETWSQEAKLQASDVSADSQFGMSVSLSGDILAVGANQEDTIGTDAGAAYIFERSGTTWTEVKRITASDGQANDEFGTSISTDGTTTFVGAYGEDTKGSNAGAAYVYEKVNVLDFDGYNKLTFTGLESGSTSNVTFDGNTYSIGTASNVYIENTGTYEAESKGTTTFALTKNVVGAIASKSPVTVAFHFNTFSWGGDPYSDGSVTAAATAGHIYSDTPTGTYTWGSLDSASTASQQTTYTWTPASTVTAKVLMVAGGGGGGNSDNGNGGGGGGGAGGVVYNSSVSLSGQQTITVGGNNSAVRGDGVSTTFTGLTTAFGGGKGAGSSGGASAGGSGGGAFRNGTGGAGTSGQGYAGGNGSSTYSPWADQGGSGGGGAGGSGADATGPNGANGGIGLDYSSVFGTTYGDSGWFASGGGGGFHSGSPGTASNGGGTSGGATSGSTGATGQKHTGGGGGGGSIASGPGSYGGSGIVLVQIPPASPSLTHDGYKLVVSGITPTSTTLKYGSNTYEIGSATNIYVENTGDYSAEIGSAADFALVSNTVSGTLKTVEPTLSGGYFFGHALTYDGKLYGWGENSSGQAGVGTSSDITVPTLCTGIPQGEVVSIWDQCVSSQNRWAKTRDGKIWVTGEGTQYSIPGQTGDQTSFIDVTSYFGDQSLTANNITQISGQGSGTTMALTETGNVWTWGTHSSSFWNLGQGTGASSSNTPKQITFGGVTDNISRVKLGNAHGVALDTDGDVWFWGKIWVNGSGVDYPQATLSDAQKSPHEIMTSNNIVGVSSTYFTIYAWQSDGTYYALGQDSAGQIGDGTATAGGHTSWQKVDYFSAKNITINEIYGGAYHVFADTSDGYYCWGQGNHGNLGNGSTGNLASPTKWTNVSNIKVFSSGSYECPYAITEDGKYYAWGNGTNNARGDNTTGDITYPKYIDTLPNILAPSFDFDGYDKVLAHMKPTSYVYEFFISVVVGAVSENNELWLQEISSTGYSLTSSMMVMNTQYKVNGTDYNAGTSVVSGLFDGSTGTTNRVGVYPGYHDLNQKIFTLTTTQELTNITLVSQRPKYMPGWKIVLNGTTILEDSANNGTSGSPEPFSITKTLSPVSNSLTKYTKDTHTYDANQAQIVTVSDPGTYDAQLSQGSVFALKSATIPATKTSGLYTWAFHHGNFDNAYGDGDILTARENGRFYADTPAYTSASIGTITPSPSLTPTYLFTISAGGTSNTWTWDGLDSSWPPPGGQNEGNLTYSSQLARWQAQDYAGSTYGESPGQFNPGISGVANYGPYDIQQTESYNSTYHITFTNNEWSITHGNFTWKITRLNGSMTTSNTTYTFTPASTLTANVLMVAGGGGGGGRYGCGGGGAGGLVYTAGTTLSGTKTIVVGNGDSGGNGNSQKGYNGKDTTFTGLDTDTAIGGGGGAAPRSSGLNGGSGGGGGGASAGDPGGVGGSGTINQGNSGGAGSSTNGGSGAGGGGSGSVGIDGTSTVGGSGGSGKFFGTGSSYTDFGDEYGEGGYFAGGGGGGTSSSATNTPGTPGRGGGGYGATYYGYMGINDSSYGGSQHALPHTGGGGGGSGTVDRDQHPGYASTGDGGVLGHGGRGGSGIVLIQTNVALPNGANTAVVQVGNPRRRSLPPAVSGMGSEVNRFYIIDSASMPTYKLPTHWYVDPIGSNNDRKNSDSSSTGQYTIQTRADGGTSNVWYQTSYDYIASVGNKMAQTADAVFMPVEQQSYDVLLSIGSNGDNDISFEMNADGTASLRRSVYTTSQVEIAGGTIVCFEVGKWHHIALTVDSGGNAVGYVNGYPVVSGTYTSVAAVGSRSGNFHFRCGVSDVTFRKFITYEVNTYNFHMSPKQVLQRAAEVGLGPKLEYDGLNAITVVNIEKDSEITIYESNVNDTSNLYVVSCNESSYLLSNAGTYYAQIKGTDTFTITRPLTVSDDHFPLYQYPPIDGTTSSLTQSASADTWNTWTISGASNGNGQYQAKTTHAPHSSSFTVYRAFNNDVSDDNGQYVDASQKTNVGLTLQLPSAKTIRKYRMYPVDHSLSSGAIPGSSTDPTLSGGDPDYKSRPKSWILKGSSDGTNWTDLDTVTDKPISIYGDVYSIDSPASYQYYQMFVVNIVDTSALLRIGEWQLWGDA